VNQYGSCTSQGSVWPNGEGVYTLIAHETGTLVAKVHPKGWDANLFVRSNCTAAESELANGCKGRRRRGTKKSPSEVPVRTGDKVYLYVDGAPKDIKEYRAYFVIRK
jgi:hypothetical protein